jgi:hypothetical protein
MEFILDPLWQNVNDDLFEHIDALQSGLNRPARENHFVDANKMAESTPE